MESQSLVPLLFALLVVTVECNSEGHDLYAWRTQLVDPNNVLQSWDPTLVNPCTWFHITCNTQNSVIRVDLGNANLSGRLVPQLGNLTNLLYLEVSDNNISGSIPQEIGHLSYLISLGLQNNQLSGGIPPTLGNLKSLNFMRLNGNKLSGLLPAEVILLVQFGNLRVMNVSDNQLERSIHQQSHANNTGFAVATIIQDSKA